MADGGIEVVGGTGRAFGTPKLQVSPLVQNPVVFKASRLRLTKAQPFLDIPKFSSLGPAIACCSILFGGPGMIPLCLPGLSRPLSTSIVRVAFDPTVLPHTMLYIDITQAYAIAAGGIFTTLFFVNLLPYVMRFTQRVLVVMCKHLTYPYAIRRHRLFGPWTRAGVLVQLVYITANLFCLSYRVSKISQAGLRAATLSLINLTPLFAGPHLGFVADLLGISLTTYRQVHGTAGLGSFGLLAFHVLQAVSGGSYSLATRRNVFGLVVSTRN